MTMADSIISISKLLSLNYSPLILDIWGVIHDGSNLYHGAQDFMRELNSRKIDYYFLSNTPRPVASTYKKLTSLGLDIDPNKIVTSGDFFLSFLANSSLYPDISINAKGKFAVVGLEKNDELLRDAQINIVDDFKSADYFIMLAFADSLGEVDKYSMLLQEALKYNLPMICINPDKIVYQGDNKRYCQGYMAQIYQEMKGQVYYFGKPYKSIYQYLFTKYKLNKSRALMIGDSLDTDIGGANTFGIDSALLLTGIHKDEPNVSNLIKLHTNKPEFILKNLVGVNE